MPFPKLTYLNRTVLTSLLVLSSSHAFADLTSSDMGKPYEGMNIQNFANLIDDDEQAADFAKLQPVNQQRTVQINKFNDKKEKVESVELKTVDMQVIQVPYTLNEQAQTMSFEDAQATIDAARRAGVIDEVREQRLDQLQGAQQPKVTIVKKTPTESESLKAFEPTTQAVIQTEAVEAKPAVATTVTQPTVTPSTATSTENTAAVAVTTPDTSSPVQAATNNDGGNDGTIDSFENQKYRAGQTVNLSQYAQAVNQATWSENMKTNTAMTLKLQALLDWNHASPGPIDGGWGGNSRKALKNFQAMQGIETTGRMNQATWDALVRNIPKNRPVLINYTITSGDANYMFTKIPATYEHKAKLPAMNYNNIEELLAERFHMSIGYLKKLNPNSKFAAGETIAVFNPSENLKSRITGVVADKKARTLYVYSGKKLVATYPTTVGSSETPSPHGTFKIVNNVKKPHYRATVEKEGEEKKIYMLKPGPNSPVGIVWMGLSKPSYGIHGSPIPEGISRQASHGCIRLTNWDAIEVNKNIKIGAKVELK